MVVLPEENGNAAERLRASGIKVIQVPLHRPRKSLRPGPHIDLVLGFREEIRTLRHIIREQRADVVQVFGPIYPHGALAARLEGVPVVWQLLSQFSPLPLRCLTMPAVVYLSDVVMTTGTTIARAHPGVTALSRHLLPFYPPVDTDEFRADPNRRLSARQELHIPPEGILVGTVGNFNRQKGHDLLIKVAARLLERNPRVYFRILGASTASQFHYYERNVKGVAARLGLLKDERLKFVEPESRVAELLPAFDIFALTSRWEGVPTTVLEAMACGIPVVSLKVGAIHEVVEEGVTGHVVESRKVEAIETAILHLLHNPGTRSAMGALARIRAVERYDTAACVETHLAAYELARHRHLPGFGRQRMSPAS